MQQNQKGQIDELMYQEDSLCYLLEPQSKQSISSLNKRRAEWLEDHLYLPSHITFNQREEKIHPHGQNALSIEKDVSIICTLINIYEQFRTTARRLAEECETEVFEKLPELEDMIKLLQGYSTNNEGGNLFAQIRAMAQEEDVEALIDNQLSGRISDIQNISASQDFLDSDRASSIYTDLISRESRLRITQMEKKID